MIQRCKRKPLRCCCCFTNAPFAPCPCQLPFDACSYRMAQEVGTPGPSRTRGQATCPQAPEAPQPAGGSPYALPPIFLSRLLPIDSTPYTSLDLTQMFRPLPCPSSLMDGYEVNDTVSKTTSGNPRLQEHAHDGELPHLISKTVWGTGVGLDCSPRCPFSASPVRATPPPHGARAGSCSPGYRTGIHGPLVWPWQQSPIHG